MTKLGIRALEKAQYERATPQDQAVFFLENLPRGGKMEILGLEGGGGGK